MDAEMSEIGGGIASGVKRLNEAISGDDFLGKKKLKEEPTSPNSPAIKVFPVSILQPYFVPKDGQEARPIIGGHEIAEVFGLLVKKSDEKKSRRIHGTVSIECEVGCQNIFERTRDNAQEVDCEESLELTGPARAFSGGYKMFARLKLMEGINLLMQDSFRIFDTYEDEEDKVYNVFRDAPSNSLVKWNLRYVVYKEAVVCTIEIKFKPSSSSVGVCGTIFASSRMFPEWRTLLFSKKRDHGEFHSIEKHDLEEQEEVLLPLLRSVAAVPLSRISAQLCVHNHSYYERPVDGSLQIEMDLVNKDDGGIVAKGVLEFKVGNYGDYVGSISSEYGEMQVKVTFVSLRAHIYQVDGPPDYSSSDSE